MNRRAFLAATGACSVVTASSTRIALAQTPQARFAAAAGYSAQQGGVSLLVVRNGIILGEDYPAGGGRDTRWPIGAGTRAFLSLLAASLVEDRLLRLDEAVSMTLGDWAVHPVKASITVRSLLNGTSGIAFPRGGARDLATAISLEPSDAPGVSFSDDPASYLLFTEVARRKLTAAGRTADPAIYLTERTLLAIGCTPIGWARSQDGQPHFDDGAQVSARGWASAGELIRRVGVWRAQQLVDEDVMREAMRGSFAEQRAGMGLWLAAPGRYQRGSLGLESDIWRTSSPAPIDLAMAAGDGGQRLYVSSSEGLVIVRQSRLSEARTWSDAQFLSLLWRDL
ncbi:serine hydrolase [Terricaulis sp.]|uniref:serine hydrolase n=1 Tax=Terricaulis sp. TaxID=2768686 RepID=UPI0037836A65